MGVDLLKHNLEAFQEINKMIESGITRIAAPRATGSGKTYLMGALAEKYNDNKKLVLEPTRPLLNDIENKFDEFGIANTDFITYQKLIRMSDEDIAAMDYKLIFLDECHHGTAPIWGKKIDCLMKTHSDSIIFGTSATTVRNDGVNVIETLFDNNAIGELPLSTAIARKVLPCPHYITAIYRLDDEFEKLKKRVEASTNTKEEKQEFYEKMKIMKTHFEKSYGIPTILNKYIKAKNGRYLVFCKNRKHLDAMRDVVIDWFRTAGIKDVHSYAVYSDYPDKEKDYKEFCEDNSDSCKILFSINMLNEGLHIKNISGVLMLRTTQSNLIYLQQLGRLVDADNIDKYLLVFDFVNNFSSVKDGIGLLQQIKDAVAKEKESNPDFNDSEFEDIDTFFVIDQVVEIQEMFRGIEGRLQGSWDLYIKALKQYKEREGDCLVPCKHIEIVDGMKVQLGQWCVNIRREHIRIVNKQELDLIGFIWDIDRDSFINNCREISKYYAENNKYPSGSSPMKNVRKLAYFISREKAYMQNKDYPVWKKKIIQEYLPGFSSESISSKSFNTFLYYAKLYKEKYGHMNIKTNDIFEGYNIGTKLRKIKKAYDKENLSPDMIQQIIDLGIFLGRTREEEFDKNMKLVTLAVSERIIINYSNQIYKEKNLYRWIMHTVKTRYQNNKLSLSEREYIQKVTGKTLGDLYGNNSRTICVRDIIVNKNIGCFESAKKAAREMSKRNIVVNDTSIYNRLNGKTTTPYKGRFMFYYATDEEIKKYLEESKAS